MENNTLLISVIIPMYNAAKTIVRALDSVKAQTADYNYQVIVVNDGSKDDGAEIVKDYIASNSESNFDISLINQLNGGVSKARNAGLKLAKGDYIAFLDSDDAWFDDKIQKQIKLMTNEPKIDFLGCAFDGLYLQSVGEDKLIPINVNKLIFKNYFQPSTVIMKKIVLDEVGYFDENQRYAEEGNYFIRVAHQFNCFFWNTKVINYGDGKSGFGVSGLSANLKEMHKGFIKNLDFSYVEGFISKPQYVSSRAIAELKYIRRLILTRLIK